MKRAQPDRDDARVAMQPEHARLLADLYILSSAAAQLGGYGLEVPNSQWRALVQQTQAARTAVGTNEGTGANDGRAALGQLITMCEEIIKLYTTGERCAPAIWREVERLGRDAYAYVSAGVTCRREPLSD
ncbi:hypothetical protein [Paraburkholderia fynbosensis]|uniref:Uncharacterized protein n=1 Tax=Paraburkholderia fynbosensis TaxID=1200993 RepID=A0A6J5GWS8_9BURK|nr:hypothetical protein [Paraburkholderia fynbosensis]CAB3807254.1 hypothetical protein LMG27177_06292 [Paraburkholderia fynbosensis]